MRGLFKMAKIQIKLSNVRRKSRKDVTVTHIKPAKPTAKKKIKIKADAKSRKPTKLALGSQSEHNGKMKKTFIKHDFSKPYEILDMPDGTKVLYLYQLSNDSLTDRAYVITVHYTHNYGKKNPKFTMPYIAKKGYDFVVPKVIGKMVMDITNNGTQPVLVNMHTKFKKDIKSKPERHTFVTNEIISHVRHYSDETDSQHKMFFTKDMFEFVGKKNHLTTISLNKLKWNYDARWNQMEKDGLFTK